MKNKLSIHINVSGCLRKCFVGFQFRLSCPERLTIDTIECITSITPIVSNDLNVKVKIQQVFRTVRVHFDGKINVVGSNNTLTSQQFVINK